MDLKLKDRVAALSGAGDGMARAAALIFAQEGAHVIVNDIIPEKAEKVAAEVRAYGVNALALPFDVSNTEQVFAAFKKAYEVFPRIDIMINSAYATERIPFSKSSRSGWEKPVNVCLYGAMNCTRAVIEKMIANRYGKVVSVLSDAGRTGEYYTPGYSAAKAAILGWSKALAKEVGRYNINVNCVSPGVTNTAIRLKRVEDEYNALKTDEERAEFKRKQAKRLQFYPLGRFGEPEDVANMLVYFSSDVAKHITGQVISVSGGYTMVG